jgi:hypothetical protein
MKGSKWGLFWPPCMDWFTAYLTLHWGRAAAELRLVCWACRCCAKNRFHTTLWLVVVLWRRGLLVRIIARVYNDNTSITNLPWDGAVANVWDFRRLFGRSALKDIIVILDGTVVVAGDLGRNHLHWDLSYSIINWMSVPLASSSQVTIIVLSRGIRERILQTTGYAHAKWTIGTISAWFGE